MKIWKIDQGEYDYVFADTSDDALQLLRENGCLFEDDVIVDEVTAEQAQTILIQNEMGDGQTRLSELFREDPSRQWVASSCF